MAKERAFFFASTTTSLGDGQTVKFWEDRWIQGQSVREIAPQLYSCIPKRRPAQAEDSRRRTDGKHLGPRYTGHPSPATPSQTWAFSTTKRLRQCNISSSAVPFQGKSGTDTLSWLRMHDMRSS